jgi:hypothetical protein
MRAPALLLLSCLPITATATPETCWTTQATYVYVQPQERAQATALVNAEVAKHVERGPPQLQGKYVDTPVAADADALTVAVDARSCGVPKHAGPTAPNASILPPRFADLPAKAIVEVESCKAAIAISWKYEKQHEATWRLVGYGERQVPQCGDPDGVGQAQG